MKYLYTTYLLIVSFLLITACSSEKQEETIYVPQDEPWTDTELDGPSATITPFLPGNEVTRSTYAFDGQKLVFGWEQGDVVAIYPTAKVYSDGDSKDGLIEPTTKKHPKYEEEHTWLTDPAFSQMRVFGCPNQIGTQTAALYNSDPDFVWDDICRWTACKTPKVNGAEQYDSKLIDFTGQVQQGLPDMIAFAKYSYGVDATQNNAKYKSSETKACIHLGKADALFSPEMPWNGERINFQLRHAGAVARFYLLAPPENIVITKMRLICDTPIFYTQCKFDMTSHPYKDEFDFGVNFSEQLKPHGTATNVLELNFAEGQCVTTNNTATDPYGVFGRYLIAYLMMYPVQYNPTLHGNMYVYVTGYEQGDATKRERRFVTDPLAAMNMKSGYYYQWISATTDLEIELTATLLPWQDIVGGNINADLTK